MINPMPTIKSLDIQQEIFSMLCSNLLMVTTDDFEGICRMRKAFGKA